MAIKQYGTIEKFAQAIKTNFSSDILNLGEKFDRYKNDCLKEQHPKLKELYRKLVEDLNKNPSSTELQEIAKEITDISKKIMKFSLWILVMTTGIIWFKII